MTSRILKNLFLSVGVILSVTLSSCGLLPEEETFRSAPLLTEPAGAEYITDVCTRGDITLSEDVSFSYIPLQSVDLSFDIGGLPFDKFYVAKGDAVTEGTLLASLDCSSYEAELSNILSSIEDLTFKRTQAEENRNMELNAKAQADASLTYEEREQDLQAIRNRYAQTIQEIDDNLYIAGLKKEQAEKEIAKRQIYAPFDGVVTYVADFDPWTLTAQGARVISIADASSSLFRANTKYWDSFTAGDHYMITTKGNTYEGVILDPMEVEEEPLLREEGKAGYVYLSLLEVPADLSERDTGLITVTIAEKKDVLSVPASAVVEISGETAVYVPDEDGFRSYKKVTVGLSSSTRAEIVEGLSEGDIVIAN